MNKTTAGLMAGGALVLGAILGVAMAPTPGACIDALHDADTFAGQAGMALGYAGDALTDPWTAARKLDSLQPQVEATMASYEYNKEKCK